MKLKKHCIIKNLFTRDHIILALETQLEPGRSHTDCSHNYISDIRLQIVITVALYGNQQVRLTTTNVVKKSRYNQPMDVVAAIHLAENEKGIWPDVAD